MSSKDLFIVHHIGGYDGSGHQYELNEKAFADVGFVRCRSEKDDSGEYWEVWIVMPFMLKGDLKNAKPEDIVSWILKHSVGNLDICEVKKSWGLGID